MYFHKDDYYIWTDDYYKFLTLSTAGFLTAPTGTILFKAVAPLQTTADKANASFPITNVNDVTDPYLEYLSTDATTTVLELTFLEDINVLFLANINFASFKVTVDSVDSTITSFRDALTGRYNGAVFFDGGVNSLTLTITTQNPTDSATYFSIGAICGGSKVTLNPRYSAQRSVIEPSDIIRFDKNNKEVNNSGRCYHVFNLNYNDIVGSTDIIALKQLEHSVGRDGTIIVYENYTDRETGIIGELTGTFDLVENGVEYFDSILRVKEKV
jgi:hypothetical protein